MRIAVLLTCHNRKDKTRNCLKSLFSVRMEHQCDVFLTDDGSTDGTSEMIKNEFPVVHLLKGDGTLFWNRGMYMAWKEAALFDYDYFLWLNDDIELYNCFLDELLDCSNILNNKGVVSGLVEDRDHSTILYGGYDDNKKILNATGKMTPIKFMNGNVVLIPKYVYEEVGMLDPYYHHDMGDLDYGLMAIKKGIRVVTTRKPVAMGHKNNYCRVRRWNTSIIERFRRLYSPLGAKPSINFYFRRKHFGFNNALCYWGFLHLINMMPDWLVVFLFGNKYTD